jgi:hypothetical protein
MIGAVAVERLRQPDREESMTATTTVPELGCPPRRLDDLPRVHVFGGSSPWWSQLDAGAAQPTSSIGRIRLQRT